MNRRAAAVIGTFSCLAAFVVGLNAAHIYYTYSMPVAESTVEFYSIGYIIAEKDYYNYDVQYLPPSETYVREYPNAKNAAPRDFTISRIAPVDAETIKIDFSDNNYTVTNSKSGLSYRPLPPFSHTETIKINQTFVAMCNDTTPPWSHNHIDHTPLTIYQYRGLEVHDVHRVKHIRPVDGEHDAAEGVSLLIHGDSTYVSTWKVLDTPKKIPVYKFLVISASADGEIPCDYPSIIRHTVDSKQVEANDVLSFSRGLYDMYA